MTPDDILLQKKWANLTRGETLDFGSKVWNVSLPLVRESDYVCLNIKGSGYWSQINYTGEGDFIRLTNFKDGSISNLGIKGGGIRLHATGSSSRNLLQKVRVQGGNGIGITADPGADSSVYTLIGCETLETLKGLYFEGDNCLAPVIQHYTCGHQDVGIDLSLGGSGATVLGGGGSNIKAFIKINGGYQLTVIGGRSELCDLFIDASYDGPTPFTVQGTTLDDVKQIIKGKSKGVQVSNVWHNSKLVDALVSD